MKNLSIVIPMRKGSKRVVNKNKKKFLNKTLFHYKIEIVKSFNIPIIVDTDDLEIIQYAKELGVETRLRPEYFASDKCSNSEYHEYLGKTSPSDYLMVAQVTNPLIKRSTYLDAIDRFKKNNCNGIMSVKKVQTFLWNDKEPINYTLDKAVNSQNLPIYWAPTFGLVICNKESLIKDKNLITKDTKFYELDEFESIDIDTNFDFWLAEQALKFKGEMTWLNS